MNSAENVILSTFSGATDSLLANETIGTAFDRIANLFPENLALVVKHQNIRWNYREFQQQVDKLATGLIALGIKPQDRVGIWAPNCYEWCVTQIATAKIGAIMACINPAYRMHELEYALNKVQCKAIISAESFKASNYLSMLESLAPELKSTAPGKQLASKKLPHLKYVIRMGEEQSNGMFNFADIVQMGRDEDYHTLAELAKSLHPDDAINIQFTSGTTGQPKGATLTHNNLFNNGTAAANNMLFTEQDKLCIPLPLYHCFGMVLGVLACISKGAAVVLPDYSFDPLTTLKAIEEEKCTAVHGVPTMFIAEMEYPQFTDFDLSSLRTGMMAGAPCPIEVMKKVMTNMHMHQVLIAYGQTELSPMNHCTTVDDPIDKKVGSVGKPIEHVEVRIVDENNEAVAIGERGEICTRGYNVMQGYWDDEERTEETIDQDGFLHSGDLGIMDKDGYVQVVGRLKDMIIRGGENIYPREIEEFLFTNPAIQDIQVFGVPHQKLGEQVCAWILNKEGETINEEDVKAFCKDQIAYYKVPSLIRFVDEYPMTVTGKIQKFKMREIMIEELGL